MKRVYVLVKGYFDDFDIEVYKKKSTADEKEGEFRKKIRKDSVGFWSDVKSCKINEE